MNETTVDLGASKHDLTDFTTYKSDNFLVDGAESVVIQTICSSDTTGDPKYKIYGSLDGTNFGVLTDADGNAIEITMNEKARIVTLRGSNVKAIQIVGSVNGSAAETLDEIIVRWK